MEAWEFGLLAVAAYVAILVLVRMMIARRGVAYQRLLEQAQAEQRRQKQATQAPGDEQQNQQTSQRAA